MIGNKLLQIVTEQKINPNEDGDWIVCMCMKPSIDMITTMLAIWKCGAGYLPIDEAFPDTRIHDILDEAQPLMVIIDSESENSSTFSEVPVYRFGDLVETSEDLSALNLPDGKTLTKGEKNMAMFMYTSGSTGAPKCVRIQHMTAQHRLEWQWFEYPFEDSEICVFKSPFIFIDHFGEIWNPLLSGKTVVIVPNEATRNPEKLVPILEKYKIQRLIAVPSLIQSILAYLTMVFETRDNLKLPQLKLWINSGEELRMSLANEFFDCFAESPRILATWYGATETMGDVITYKIESREQLMSYDRIPIGKPTHNTRVYILDENKKPLKEGELGEIYISGAVILGDGYINGHDMDTFMRNNLSLILTYWYLCRIGDYGMIKDDLVFFYGRRDKQIKVHGHRVEINEVENIINKLHFLERAVVQVHHRGEADQKVVAFIKLKGGFAFRTIKEIEEDMHAKMPSYMIPQVILINQFRYLQSGKVDAQALMRGYRSQIEGNVDPSTEIQIEISDIPEELQEKATNVFKIIGEAIGSYLHDKVSSESKFEEIGGNSINTILCVNKLREANYGISISDFINASSIGEILDKIEPVSSESKNELEAPDDMDISVEPLTMDRKEECIAIIGTAFLEKGDLDQLLPGLMLDHFVSYLSPMWEYFVVNELSFMVINRSKRIVGVSLNFELGNEPRLMPPKASPLESIIEYLGFVENEIV